MRPLALALAVWLAAPAALAAPLPSDRLRLLPPAHMGGFTLRSLWEQRYATSVGGRPAGEVWRVEARYDFAAEAPPLDRRGRPLPDPAMPGCPVRHDHGLLVALTASWGGDEPRACGGGRRGGEAVPMGAGCATLRHNLGDKAETEGPWALEWREAGVDFTLRLGPGAEALPDAPARLLAAGAAARAWASAFAGGALPDLPRLAVQRAVAEAALAAGRAEVGAPPACQSR
ncbi:MAG: hypothetical protein IPO09_21125 [Anaeromyxobacter sp.]|nr:hypothetical protein [Anaeromyxobacter sp.]MBL0274734.1 hypothetical protein [Anaeromyxobacter sp.]